MPKHPIDALRDIVRRLKPSGDDGFEGLLAVVLTDVTKTSFSLAKSGPQGGKDGQSSLDGGSVCFEAKLYDEKVTSKEILYKVPEIAAADKGQVDLRIVGSTGTVSSQDADVLKAACERLGIGALVLDWAPSGLSALAALLGMADAASVTFLADKTGVPEAEIRKGIEAVKAHPQFGDRTRELSAAIDQPSVAPAYALKKNAEFLRAAFGSRVQARLIFGQPLAPGDISVPGLLDRTALRASLARTVFAKPNGNTTAILGADGNGKSWLFGQCWLNQAPKPLTMLIVPDDIRLPFTHSDAEPLLIKTLIAQTSDSETEIIKTRWRKHFQRWRKSTAPDQPRLVVFFDGLNQRESVEWSKVINTFSKAVGDLGGKVVFSCRTPYFQSAVKSRLLDNVDRVEVPEWSNPELETLLQERGASITTLQQPVIDFLRNPRIFAVAAELCAQGHVKFSDLTISRLLFEYIRAGASPAAEPMPVPDFVAGVRSHADDIIERLKTPDTLDTQIFKRKVGPSAKSLTLEDQLKVISAGRFFEEVAGDATLYSLRDEGLPFALGLSILSTAQQAERNKRNIKDELTKILQPIMALDRTAEVLISALIAGVLGEETSPEVIAALAASYTALRNLDASRYQEFHTLVRDAPMAFLLALEEATIAEGTTANLSWLTSALHESREEAAVWTAITDMVQRWLSMYSPAPDRGVHVMQSDGPEKRKAAYDAAKAEIDKKLTAFSATEKALFDTMVLEERGNYTKLNKVAIQLLAGRPLKAFGHAFRNWCLAASFNGGIWDGRDDFHHLVQLNRVDWQETRDALLTAAEPLRGADISETGKWALVYAVRATGAAMDFQDIIPVIEDLTKDRPKGGGWRLIENWCATDPCDPTSERPDNIDQTAVAYEQIDVAGLRTHMGHSRDDHFFEGARAGLARFEPAPAIRTMRRLAKNAVSRKTADFRMAAFLLENHTAALDAQNATAFVRKADEIANEGLGSEDKDKELFVASQYTLMIALPHMSGDEQLAALMAYPTVDNILLSACALFQDADPAGFERALERAYADGDTINQFRLMAFAEYTDTPITDRAKTIIGELTASTAELVRLCAFGTIRRLKDRELLRLVVDSGWSSNSLDRTKARFEIWYGSQILVLAVAERLISVADCIDRIDLTAFGDFMKAGGAEAAALVAIRIDLALKKAAGHEINVALPEIEQRIGTGDRPDLYNVEDRPDPKESPRDSFKRLAETGEAWYERQKRNRETVERLERELTSAGAQLILQAITPEFIAAIYQHEPQAVRQWQQEFMAMDAKRLRAVHNAALPVAQVIAKDDPAGAVALFEKLEQSDPFVHITIGTAGLSLDAVMIWEAGDGAPLRDLRYHRLDHAKTDADLSREVLAAMHAGKADQLREYILDRRSRAEPAYIGRAIMVCGFGPESDWALETVEAHKDDGGFLSDAYDAAKYAMDRHRWAKHWARMMRDASTPEDLWRYSVLFAMVVDGRFDQAEVKGGPNPQIIERFGPTLNGLIKTRIKKWQDKRAKKLFGQDAPDDIFLA